MFLLGQQVGKYQILANLGSGASAPSSWPRHVDRQEGRDQGAAPSRRRFRRAAPGAALLARSTTRTSVGIVTAERVDGVFFIVMEYVKGPSLEAVLDKEKTLPVPLALNYTVQILKGVEHAHQATILHRDLRPATSSSPKAAW